MKHVATKHSSQTRKRYGWEISRYRKNYYREVCKCAPSIGTKFIYDDKGRSTGSIRYKGCTVSIAPDGTSTVSVLGTKIYQTSTEYDTKGRVKSSTDAYGNVTTYEYDSLDRQIKVKQSNGLITETVYNSKGQVWKTIIKSGSDVRTTEYKYDIYGNIEETIQPDGTKISAEYNNKGQKISETNQLGQTRTFEYDDNGQLIKVTLLQVNGESPIYEYTYDAQGNQLTIKDPNGNVTSFTYDVNGNQLTRTLPDNDSIETFEYDSRGRVVRETSFEGVVTTYKYDAYDRLESKTFLNKDGITETWTYTYDALGRVSEINQNGRITKTTYDAQGRTASIETPEGKITYTYNEFGQQTSVQTDNDEPTLYSYDNFGRLKTVEYDNLITTYEYDTFGNLIKTTTDTGAERLVTAYQYDNMNRLTKLTNFKDVNKDGVFDSGEGISEFEYTLNDIGQKTKALEKFWADYNNDGGIDLLINNIDWEYDALGRLTSEVFDHYANENDQTQEWEYDLVGNRTLQILDKGNDGVEDARTTYTYDVNDRLIEEILDDLTDANKDRTTVYDYDHTQQTYKSVSENGIKLNETKFKYDAQGRMSVVTITTFAEDGTATRIERTSYEYGADGIRVSALHEIDANGDGMPETSKLTECLNDPLNITGYSQVLKQVETDLETGEETHIIYVIGHQRISQITVKNGTEQEYYFTFDGHGSTRALTDFAGAIAQLYAFDAYGNAIGFNPSEALTEFLYSGEQFDSKIGQQYLRARYYDPATGRFNRLDPFFGNLDDPQSLHKYLYTHADPVNGIDPDGLMSLGSMMCSVGIGLGKVGMVTSTVGSVFTGIRIATTIIDLTTTILALTSDTSLTQKITQTVNTYIADLFANSILADVMALKEPGFWESSVKSMINNIPRIGKSIFRSELIRTQVFNGIKNNIVNKDYPRVIIQLPVPYGLSIPKSIIPIPFAKIPLGHLNVGLSLQIGSPAKQQGRLIGFAVMTSSHESSIHQIFRQDYHEWHNYSGTIFDDIRWQDQQVKWNGGRTFNFHYHVPK
jgi:RHS repeat-associated protein